MNRKIEGAGTVCRAGVISSALLALFTAGTFLVAIFTPPISGPFAAGETVVYPYRDILGRFPRDYYWMYPALLMALIFVVYVISVTGNTSGRMGISGTAALVFASMSSLILFTDYFIQLSVIQPSLLLGEYEGLALYTQYNPHGLFIVLEEAGYLLMAIAIAFLYPSFAGKGKIRAALRWITVVNITLSVGSLALISFLMGIRREYIFEVAVISFNFIALILLGILSAVLFLNRETSATS